MVRGGAKEEKLGRFAQALVAVCEGAQHHEDTVSRKTET